VIARVERSLRLAVLGLGRVGTTTAACLAAAGHRVYGVDLDSVKLAAFAAGRSPVVEPGLDDLLRSAFQDGLLAAGPTVEPILDELDMVLICIGTPARPEGGLDESGLLDILRRLGRGLRRRPPSRPPLWIVVRSTLAPGTMDRLVVPTLAAEADSEPGSRFEVAYNPEFLREGSALEDHLSATRILVGERTPGVARRLLGIYDGFAAPLLEVPFRLAESLKVLDNAFHALKVAFANELGRVALAAGVDPGRLAELLLMDRKLNLSPAYLRPGGPYGGPCLEKDLGAVLAFAREAGLELPVLAAVPHSNARHLEFLLGRIRSAVPPPGPVLLIGVSFKEGADDLRGSPNLALAEALRLAGYELDLADPDLDRQRFVAIDGTLPPTQFALLNHCFTDDLDSALRRARLIVLGKAIPGLAGRLPGDRPVLEIPKLRLP
jgi:GDP-mannose 6-dehydrogenase